MDLNILTVGTSVNIKRSNGNIVYAILCTPHAHRMHTPCTIIQYRINFYVHTHTHTSIV